MYFDISPKGSKADFFNYDYEYGQIKAAIAQKEKIIAVIGVRRVGKTSLLNLLFNEAESAKVWLDGRIITEPKKEIFSAIYETVKSGKPKIFGRVESLNISAFGIGLGIKPGGESRMEIEKAISKARICVFIDEAQRMDRQGLADVLSYFYDRFPNISFIVSGSEVGLVEEILGEGDSAHPLYGRSVLRIQLNRLDHNKALEFLRTGFQQAGVKATEEELLSAISELDGLIGWLALFGHQKAILKNPDAMGKTLETAAGIAASELSNFLKKAKNRGLYLCILRSCSGTGWTELMVKSGKALKKTPNENTFNFALKKLLSYSFIEKKDGKYHLSDPLILKATYLV